MLWCCGNTSCCTLLLTPCSGGPAPLPEPGGPFARFPLPNIKTRHLSTHFESHAAYIRTLRNTHRGGQERATASPKHTASTLAQNIQNIQENATTLLHLSARWLFSHCYSPESITCPGRTDARPTDRIFQSRTITHTHSCTTTSSSMQHVRKPRNKNPRNPPSSFSSIPLPTHSSKHSFALALKCLLSNHLMEYFSALSPSVTTSAISSLPTTHYKVLHHHHLHTPRTKAHTSRCNANPNFFHTKLVHAAAAAAAAVKPLIGQSIPLDGDAFKATFQQSTASVAVKPTLLTILTKSTAQRKSQGLIAPPQRQPRRWPCRFTCHPRTYDGTKALLSDKDRSGS